MRKTKLDISKISIKPIEHSKELKQFLDSSKIAQQTFTYYQKRPINQWWDHLYSVLLWINNQPVGYGHLEKENDTLWLGICVCDNYQKKGLGKIILTNLVDFARKNKIGPIELSVYKDNLPAISLYERFGFKRTFESEKSIFMKLSV